MAEENPEQTSIQPGQAAGDHDAAVGLRGGTLWALVLVALGLALVSAGYVGHRLYVDLTRDDPLAQLRERVGSQLTEQGNRLGELNRTLRESETRHSSLQLTTEDELATLRERLDAVVRMVAEAAAPSKREWKLAEVEYLLRIANHRATMEQDVRGALKLTQAADGVLESLDDFSLHDVRAELAREINALKLVPGLDVSGIYVRIDALNEQVGRLQARKPWEQSQDPVNDAPVEERSAWAMIAERLSYLVRIRVADALPRRPHLSADEVRYLHQVLHLQLEQAKLGLLQTDQALYAGSLASTAMWVREYFDPEAATSVVVLDELSALAGIQIVNEIPDISGSLNLLRARRRTEEG